MTVIVLSRRADTTADVVVSALDHGGADVLRADLGELEVEAELDGDRWVGELRAGRRATALHDVTGVLHRRPSRPRAPTDLHADVGRWVVEERRWGVRGLLVALPRPVWLSWPPAVHAAEHKPYALGAAAAAGLTVPRTLVTNRPDAARAFAHDVDALYKAFRNGPVDTGAGTVLTFSTPVRPERVDASVAVAPIALQERVDKAFDARVVCVDHHVVAVSPRRSHGAVPLDWRDDHAANRWHEVVVPVSVRAGLLRLLDTLGLRFCAADFAVDHDGRWHHLDLNPVGQWAWEHPLRDDVTTVLVTALTEGTGHA